MIMKEFTKKKKERELIIMSLCSKYYTLYWNFITGNYISCCVYHSLARSIVLSFSITFFFIKYNIIYNDEYNNKSYETISPINFNTI